MNVKRHIVHVDIVVGWVGWYRNLKWHQEKEREENRIYKYINDCVCVCVFVYLL